MSTTAAAEIDPVEAELEAAINAVVDATPVLDEQPAMSPQVLWAFCTDVAQNVMSYREIATRYGFVDVPQLREFLVAQHAVRRKVKEIRAIYESDENVETRIRHLAGHAVLAALPGTAQIMLNPRNPDSTRLEALQKHARIAGVDRIGAGNENNAGMPVGGRFSVNIVFPNAGKVESFTTIDHTPEADRGFGSLEEKS